MGRAREGTRADFRLEIPNGRRQKSEDRSQNGGVPNFQFPVSSFGFRKDKKGGQKARPYKQKPRHVERVFWSPVIDRRYKSKRAALRCRAEARRYK